MDCHKHLGAAETRHFVRVRHSGKKGRKEKVKAMETFLQPTNSFLLVLCAIFVPPPSPTCPSVHCHAAWCIDLAESL